TASAPRATTEPGGSAAVCPAHGGFGPRAFSSPPEHRRQNSMPAESTAHFTTPLEAEAAFYRALAEGNLDALMAVWSEEEEIVCVHPGGPRIVGLAAVHETWRRILAGGTRIEIEVSHA